MEVCVEVLKRRVPSPSQEREVFHNTGFFQHLHPLAGLEVWPSAGQVELQRKTAQRSDCNTYPRAPHLKPRPTWNTQTFHALLLGWHPYFCRMHIKVRYQINACYPMTPMMGDSILRKNELCGHRSCAGLPHNSDIGTILTLFPSSNTNVLVVRVMS